MSGKAKSIMEGLAGLFGSGSRQGGSAKQAQPEDPMPMATEMAKKANPVKRKLAADSLKKAFGK